MTPIQSFNTSNLPERQANLNPVQWNLALGMARKICSDVFQEGGNPTEAVQSYGDSADNDVSVQHWGHAINLIAFAMYAPRRQSIH